MSKSQGAKIGTSIVQGFVLAVITSITGCIIPPLAPLVALGFIPIWIGWAFFIYFVRDGEGPFDD